MKLLSERKKMCDEGKINMCMAEYNGSWLPYKQPFDKVTYDWLLEELTYDDCERKEEIVEYLIDKYKDMEQQIYKYNILKDNINSILTSL